MILSLFAVLMLIACSVVCSANTSNILLSANGKPLAAIIVPFDAIPAEQTAAKELASHLKMVTGAEFPIVASADQTRQQTRIFIGQTEATKSLIPGFDFSQLGRDGIVIRKTDAGLILAGDRPRGTLYAVYTFLEDFVGCKWWTAQARYVPKKPTLRVRVKDVIYASPFYCRSVFYKNIILGYAPEFAVRLKLNGHYQYIPPEWGGHYWIVGGGHSFYPLLPPDKYFTDHPEWYSEVGGKRVDKQAQLCLTNEEMRKELTKNALDWVKERPDAGILDISQNDYFGACQCAKCQAVVKREGAESGPIVGFVNAVAEDVKKHYPDFLVQTFAYQYTQQAPANVKPADNVAIRLCSIEADFARPLNSKSNTRFYNDIRAWQAISSQLYVWDYTVGFGNLMMPNANFRVLAPNIRIFAGNKVTNLFEQGDGYNPDSNFAAMKTWLISHLMWNPKADENKLMNEFLNGYYGPAGKYLRQYINLICDAVEASNQLLRWNSTDYDYLSPEVLNKAMKLFDAAEKSVAGDEELLKRVSLQRAAVDLAVLLSPSDPGLPRGKELERIYERFIAVSDQSGNIYRQEGIVMSDEYRRQLKDKAHGKITAIVPDFMKAASMEGYSDAETFADMYKTMTEILDLPKDGWRFQLDKHNAGEKQGWQKADFDDSAWQTISIGKFWEEQIGEYDGHAWYRRSFNAPAVEPGKQVFLAIGAADDAAKVWLNGIFIAERQVGWDQAFALEITQMLEPGQENALAVQVNDTTGYGGLWKSIKLMVK